MKEFFRKYMHRRERAYYERDNNRVVRPFEWGLPFIVDHVNGDDPGHVLSRHTENVLQNSEAFYYLPPVTDFQLRGDRLTWTSAVQTDSAANNIARARFFPAKAEGRKPKRAVVVLPQWNADPNSHVEACRIFNFIGISALRLTLPYHEDRRPPELERADHLVGPNIGRTIQSFRQGVLDTRAAVQWLSEEGYERIGILGTSIGSCIAFLTFAHEPRIVAGTFNHVSGFVADVAWKGISTQHVREGLEERGQGADVVEDAAQEGEGREDEGRHEVELLEALRPEAGEEADGAEGDRGQHREGQRVRDVDDVDPATCRQAQRRCRQPGQGADEESADGGGADHGDHHLAVDQLLAIVLHRAASPSRASGRPSLRSR